MKKLSSRQLRDLFLDYFREKGHEIVPSSPLVPANDPTLLFTNAGMVQFKGVFLGEESRPYKRAASCQKCVRAGGKHNDLENVGYTARHHTFFEMLGNFSFGDYFKAEAISFAWELLVKRIGLPVGKLWVTVFEKDDEAARLWPELTGISPDRVVRLGEKDNFWAMGDTGPCGPCSEILIDQGPEVGCRRPDCKVGCDCDRYLELWNLVFMQYFRDQSGTLSPLPKPSIDTGMGLERIAAICQGVKSNFDTDVFSGLLAEIERLSGTSYGQDQQKDVAMRVIADHARASAFLVADGVIPSNEGRGYVLRRIIRRAVRYGRVLGLSGPFLGTVASVVVKEMGDIYPELERSKNLMAKILEHEESRFLETLEYGLGMLDHEVTRLRSHAQDTISGEFIFKLYDTYGFPIDIVQDVAKEQGLKIDKAGFEKAMAIQRLRSKMAHKEASIKAIPKAYSRLLEQGETTRFVGYDTLIHNATVLALVKDGQEVDFAQEGWCGELVVDKTPFYPEAGGQVGDKGQIEAPEGLVEVIDTLRRGEVIVHKVKVIEGKVSKGDQVELRVTQSLRLDTARNHTATHLLHAALRAVLGDHVKQAGSLVAPQRLRFDFTHFSQVSTKELHEIEDIVNEKIREDIPLSVKIVPYKTALDMGATALFGEKYSDEVRVVEIPGFSMELCGGTHLDRTGRIGFFKIITETSVASGVRRIEAVTGQAAVGVVHDLEDSLNSLAGILKCPVGDLEKRSKDLLKKVKDLEKALQRAMIQGVSEDLDELLKNTRTVSGVKVVAAEVGLGDAKAMRELGDRIRDKIGSGVVVLGTRADGNKALLLVMVTKDLSGRIHAGKIIRSLAGMVGGGGGGRPDMAQAGGSRPERLKEAIEAAYGVVEGLAA